MPAWAQLAAAAVIFAAGATFGSLSMRTVTTTPGDMQTVRDAAAREDVTRIERRLTALEREREQINRPTLVRLDDQAREAILMRVAQRVDNEIRESEDRTEMKLASFGLRILKDSSDKANEQLQQDREERMRDNRMLSQTILALSARNTD
jgi:hypothetical protein